MNYKSHIATLLYKNLFRPIAFQIDAEIVHDTITKLGENLENQNSLLSWLFAFRDPALKRKVLGIDFENPTGLSAGFDYDGHLAKVLKYIGFGFNTVGTVTAKPYEGNPKPRLVRLPKSRSILVNKGFKSEGAIAVAQRLDKKDLQGHTVGISIGSTNSPKVNTINKAIDDYTFSFDIFKKKKYIKYFELNISCPNTNMTESFIEVQNFKNLVKEVTSLSMEKPIFVKMPNEIDAKKSDLLVEAALTQGISGFIFSNLVKNRENRAFDQNEILNVANLKGNFSGKPTTKGANHLISHTRKKFGGNVAIIGCGGVFNTKDALEKFSAGADLIQLITGIIFEGPQLISQICRDYQLHTHY
ncbi:MAG: quinone-dependent dihydroorotate dehydrogenase [Candidatus Blackburnbacteria bacterium]|nr:quinone-dependent dihydroorotate dehydrogenase [Candidatus Blackburnbacteria bacterium]